MNGAGRMSKLGLAVVVVLAALVMAGCMFLVPDRGVQIGTSVLLLYVLLSRLVVTGDHQLALWYQAHHDYELAIPRLEASLRWFERHRWLDRLRFLLLLSPTGYGYRELALLGLGHCNAQLGRAEARDWYQACLRAYPDNATARAALEILRRGAELGRRRSAGAEA